MYGLCLNSMTYHIIQVGNFFGSFSFTCLFHLVVDLETLTLWCSFSAPLQLQLGSCIFCILWQALPVFAVPPPLPPLFYECSTISLTGLSWHSSSSPPQITSRCWKLQRSQAKNYLFFLPKKYMSVFPHSVFSLSLLSRHVLFLDCLTICCSECL